MDQWIKGGPYLEVSFMLEHSEDKTKFVSEITDKIRKIPQKIEVKSEMTEKDFGMNLIMNIAGERKGMFGIKEVANNTYVCNFCFFGSVDDVPEWGQKGIKLNEIPKFADFLCSLYEIFNFPLGAVAIENDCLSLFNSKEGWPNEDYELKNLDLNNSFKKGMPQLFEYILINKSYFPKFKTKMESRNIGKEGILVKGKII